MLGNLVPSDIYIITSWLSLTVHGLYKYHVQGYIELVHTFFWMIEKAREFQKNIYFCFIDYAKAFDCVDHNKLENS